MSAEGRAEARELVLSAVRRLVAGSYLVATGGNVSVRVRDEETMASTPSGSDSTRRVAEAIVILGPDLQVVEGGRKPSIESALHAVVYLRRPETRAVAHTHQVNASALAVLGAAIPPLFDEQVRYLGRRVRVVPYRPSGTALLVRALGTRLGDHSNAYLLKSHGALCLGQTMERAVHNVELLEKCAAVYLLALCTARRVSRVPPIIRDIAFARLRADQKREARS